MATQLTDLNLTTSAAVFVGEQFADAGWAVYWQATDILSGTAVEGEVTIVPEFPDDPSLLVLPPATRSASKILLPAFAVTLSSEPFDVIRAGLGETIFEQRSSIMVDGFVADQSQHLAFATMFRNWFRDGVIFPVRDYESSPTNPSLIDIDVIFEGRRIDRTEFVDPSVPPTARYYLNMEVDLMFFE
jgi:hypothetical protein